MSFNIFKEADEATVIIKLCELVEKYSNAAISSRSAFRIGLSGNFKLVELFDL